MLDEAGPVSPRRRGLQWPPAASGYDETLCVSNPVFTMGRCPSCFNRGTFAMKEMLKKCTVCDWIMPTVASVFCSPPPASPVRPASDAMRMFTKSPRIDPDHMLPKPRMRRPSTRVPATEWTWGGNDDDTPRLHGQRQRRELKTAPTLEYGSLFGMHRVGGPPPHVLLPLLGGEEKTGRAATAVPSTTVAGVRSGLRGAPASSGASIGTHNTNEMAVSVRTSFGKDASSSTVTGGRGDGMGEGSSSMALARQPSRPMARTRGAAPGRKGKKRPPFIDPRPSQRREFTPEAEARTDRWKQGVREAGHISEASYSAWVQSRLADAGVSVPPVVVSHALSTPSERNPHDAMMTLPSPRSAAAADKARHALLASGGFSPKLQTLQTPLAGGSMGSGSRHGSLSARMPHGKGADPQEARIESRRAEFSGGGAQRGRAAPVEDQSGSEVLPWMMLPGSNEQGWAWRGNGIYDDEHMAHLRDESSRESDESGDDVSDGSFTDGYDARIRGDWSGGDDGSQSGSDEVLYGDDAVAALEAASMRFEAKQAALRAEAEAAARAEAEQESMLAADGDRLASIDENLFEVDALRQKAWRELEEMQLAVQASARAIEAHAFSRRETGGLGTEAESATAVEDADEDAMEEVEQQQQQQQQQEETEETEETEEAEEENAEGANTPLTGGKTAAHAWSVTVLDTADVELAVWPRKIRGIAGSGPL